MPREKQNEMPCEKRNEKPREKRDEQAATGGFLKKFDGIIDRFDEDDNDEYDDGFPPTPPPAPGEHGRQQVGSSPCLCPTNTRRASLEAVCNITPPPAIQRARGVASTTPPAPHDRAPHDCDGHHTGVEASSPPPLQSTIAQIAAFVHGRVRIAEQRDPPTLGQRSRPRHWYLPPR